MTDLTEPAVLAVFDALLTVPQASGFFDEVNGHEPKNAPSRGLTAALWLDHIDPNPQRSGGAAVSLVCHFNLRLYTSMLAPTIREADAIDPNLMIASVAMMAAYAGNFTLGGAAAAIDLLGMTGTALSAQAGYLGLDGKLQRVVTLIIPVMIDDAFAEVA